MEPALASVTAPDLLAVFSGSLIGFILAVIGGGGSILATPLLLYVVGVTNPHVAIGTGAAAVAASALINLAQYARSGTIKWPCSLTFAAAGVFGAALGAQLGKLTDARVLLPLFALLMIAVGVIMLIPKRIEPDHDVHITPGIAARLIGAGSIVGGASGFFGIGGGFLIVPGLMGAAGMAIGNAVASSLASVAAFGATTATSYAFAGLVDWRIAGLFIAGGLCGSVLGMQTGKAISRHKGLLQNVFAGVIFLVAAYMLWRSL